MATTEPRPPKSPLQGLRDEKMAVVEQSWRRVALTFARSMLVAWAAGVVFLYVPPGTTGLLRAGPTGPIDSFVAICLLQTSSSILLALLAFRMAYAPGRRATAAGIVAAFIVVGAAAVSLASRADVEALWNGDPLPYTVASLSAFAATYYALWMGARNRPALTIAAACLAVPPLLHMIRSFSVWPHLMRDPWGLSLVLTSGLLPIVGAGTLTWLLHTRPGDPGNG